MPDLEVSGYPISIQLNPYHYRRLKILLFKLFDHQTGAEIKPVRLLTQKLDPNHLLTAYQYALFPLERLHWNHQYQAEVIFKANGKQLSYKWRFKTRDLGAPTFRIQAQNERLYLEPNKKYAVYVPPTASLPIIRHLRWEAFTNIRNQLAWVDKNTIIVQLAGKPCDEIHFHLDGDRAFTLEIADSENLNPEHRYPKNKISLCAQRAISQMSGFKIKGQGESIKVEPDREYWIEIVDPDQPLSKVKYRYMEGMNIQLTQLSKNIFTFILSGKAGQTATFLLSDTRSFDVQLQ